MRIDKFLKVSRLIKRREIAKDLCLAGNVLINEKKAKPMSEVSNGDTIDMKLGKHSIRLIVNEVREFANKEQALAMYEIIKDDIEAKQC